MYSFHTLQDFVLNLLNDEAARSAYAADPQAALADAGLGDLTPQDVAEVIPLVTDALPADTPIDLAGDLTGGLVDVDFDRISDGQDVTGGSLLAGVGDLGYGGVLANDAADGADLWAGTQTVAGRVAGVVQTGDNGFVETGVSTPLVYAGANTNGDYLITTTDPGELLDNLGDGTDAAAGAATHLVGTGAGSLAGAVENGADTLAGFLAGTPAAPAAEAVTDGADLINQGLAAGAGTVGGHLDDLRAVDLPGAVPVDLPTADTLPVTLPELPDVAGNVGDLPGLGDLDLPARLPDLPVDLPVLDTDTVTDVVSHSPVADAVNASPVGGLTDTVAGAADGLPVVGDLTDTLNLGL